MAKGKTLRALSTKKIEDSDFALMAEEIREASDRTAAIVMGAFVERELEQWIVKVLPRRDEETIEKLYERDGALGSFYAKIYLGYALGVYDETTRDNLDIVRRIRNAFAHTPQQIGFETDAVKNEIEKLKPTTSMELLSEFEKFSESGRKFMSICAEVSLMHRLEPIGSKMELMSNVIEAISSHLTGEIKQLAPDAAAKLAQAVAAIKKIRK